MYGCWDNCYSYTEESCLHVDANIDKFVNISLIQPFINLLRTTLWTFLPNKPSLIIFYFFCSLPGSKGTFAVRFVFVDVCLCTCVCEMKETGTVQYCKCVSICTGCGGGAGGLQTTKQFPNVFPHSTTWLWNWLIFSVQILCSAVLLKSLISEKSW